MLRRKPVASRDPGLAGRTAPKRPALREKLGTRRSMYRAIHPTTSKKRAVRGVDYCVNLEGGDVSFDYFSLTLHGSIKDRSDF
jgi:hypothetical protein